MKKIVITTDMEGRIKTIRDIPKGVVVLTEHEEQPKPIKPKPQGESK
jgi:hypothetical protein